MKKNLKVEEGRGQDRREFFRQSLASGLMIPAGALKPSEQQVPVGREVGTEERRARIPFPRVFKGRQLATIAFPLGGIGTGSISLGGRGQLRDWEIFNRPSKGRSPEYCFAALQCKIEDGREIAKVLESRFQPPYEQGPSGLGSANMPGLPRFESSTFTGEFPFARVDFSDPDIPLDVALEAFTPFTPLEAEASGLPAVILRYRVVNKSRKRASVSVAFSLDNPAGKSGRRNESREQGAIRGLFMHDPELEASDPLKGTFALVTREPAENVTILTGWEKYGFWVAPLTFWRDFSADGRLDPDLHKEPNRTGSLSIKKHLAPGSQAEFTFVLAWHFPNRTPQGCGWTAPEGHENDVIGNYYTERFSDAWEAADYVFTHLEQLERDSRDFLRSVKESDLEPVVIEAALANLSTLRTQTVFRTADGRFHAFEGSGNDRGCCVGSCTHVLNYETALPFLFPSLSRSLRELNFDFSTDDEGRMDFRYLLPYGIKHFGLTAADGQMGTIVKFYLDWKLSGDDRWLARWWPKVKKALEFAWVPGGWDEDRDGVMEGVQHVTFDVEFFGPNPLCQFWYLAALRACQEMAEAVGDRMSAGTYRRLFEQGSAWTDAHLFNGEYYIQLIRPRTKDKIASGLVIGVGARDPENPDFQAGDACLTDQLVGQYAAHVAGLGYLANPANIRRALQSILKYNFKRDLSSHENYARTFALNNDAGVAICSFPKPTSGPIRVTSTPETWSGSEYQLAAHLLYEGMHREGIEIVEAIRSRHDGEKRNPWNEPECGHHYMRALSSWSAMLALTGWSYDGRTREVAVTPRRGLTKGFWCAPTGW
ncbi:MAG TPA: GH116 family glycosyl-hydrolase, partial [Acidobacteriota bacterium]|nr:GH116 family glycosyl-hydrolase [Acidobacteriota bacterium]